MVPNIPYAWQTKSEPIRLPASRGKSLNVVGLMNRNNDLFFQINEDTFNSEKMIKFMDKFALQTKKKTIVVLDNCSIHKSKAFKAKIEEWKTVNDLYIFFLPPYSPELNPIEILWKRIKYQWLSFDSYDSFTNLKSKLNCILSEFGTKYDIKF